jgi:hypothetical protein
MFFLLNGYLIFVEDKFHKFLCFPVPLFDRFLISVVKCDKLCLNLSNLIFLSKVKNGDLCKETKMTTQDISQEWSCEADCCHCGTVQKLKEADLFQIQPSDLPITLPHFVCKSCKKITVIKNGNMPLAIYFRLPHRTL